MSEAEKASRSAGGAARRSWPRSRVAAAGCGGDDDSGGGDWQIEGLGSTLEEIQANAKEEGEVNIVQWPQYATLVDEFEAATGCQVNTKDAGTGDEMIQLIQSGEYDGVSASGHTSVRLMAAGDVAPVNPDLLPNYADIAEDIKLKSYNSKDGEPYGAPHGRGPEPARVPHRRSHAGPGQLVGRLGREHAVQGQDLDLRRLDLHRGRCAVPEGDAAGPRDREPVPADAGAVRRVGRAAQDARAERGRVVEPTTRSRSSRSPTRTASIGTTWPLQVTLLTGDKQPVEGIKPKEGTTGWSDTWMIASNASNPNCMYLWMDHMMAPKTQATVAEGFGEAPANLKACELTKNPNHCTEYHADDASWWEDVYYWDTPTEDCGGEGGTCVTQEDWRNAWTEIRG